MMLNNGMSPIYNPFELKKADNEFLSMEQGLSPGCQSCKDGSWWCLYVGHRCNLDCTYCPQGTAESKRELIDHPDAMQRLWIDDIKRSLMMVEPGTIRGISYSGGEPLLFIDKILDMGKFVSKNFPYIYQWCYTNGMLVTEDKLKSLVDVGLSEIRFHLGATKFHPTILERLAMACKIFKRVTVENPANPELRKWLIEDGGLLLLKDIGVTQLNCAEQYFVNERAKNEYPDTEMYTYTSMARGLHESPTFSRHVTYDIIDYADQNGIDIIINDCSHESRDCQIMTRELNKNRLREMY